GAACYMPELNQKSSWFLSYFLVQFDHCSVEFLAFEVLSFEGRREFDLNLHNFLPNLKRLSTRDLNAVDERVGGALNSECGPEFHVSPNFGLKDGAIQRSADDIFLETHFFGVRQQIIAGQCTLILK